MTRYKATISYDGTLFAGFQRQPHARSVQEEIEKTLMRLNQGNPCDHPWSRSGRMQVSMPLGRSSILIYPQPRDEEKLRFALDTQTPEDIDFIRVEQVPEDFHSRYQKHSKTYEFIVDYGRPKNPMMRHYATHYPYPLDVEKMQVAIRKLEGTHDFTGFTASGTSVEDKVRTITEARLVEDVANHRLLFTFSGNGFLYKQIRNMVGTLLKIGNDRMPIEQIDLIFGKEGPQSCRSYSSAKWLIFKGDPL